MSSIHLILPAQYLQNPETRLAAPQKRLMLAVLETVLHDCEVVVGETGTTAGTDRRTQLQAVEYFQSRDRSWPFSFDNICDAIGLDAEGIRRALRQRLAHLAS